MLTSKRFDADVVVCGGGPAGFASALAAARDGKRVILLEWREPAMPWCGLTCPPSIPKPARS